MMNTLKLFFVTGLVWVSALNAQEPLSISLEEAKVFAQEHNKTLKNARMDKEIAEKSVWEAISTGLPQVSASFDYTNFFNYEFGFSFGGGEMPLTQTQINDIYADAATEYPTANFSTIQASNYIDQAIQDALPEQKIILKDQAGAKLQVSQLVFSGQYIVAIQSAKLAKDLIAKSYNKSVQDVNEMVESAYYLTLVTQRTLNILEENISNIDKTVAQTQAMVDAGMMEQIEADQLKMTSVQLQNSKKSMERALEMNYNMLRFQLGVEAGTKLELTSILSDLVNAEAALQSAITPFEVGNNIDYQLYEGQEEISKKMLDLEKSTYLPTIAAFYTYNAKIITTDFDMNAPHVIGFNVSLPLFTSWNRQTKVNKARIELDKVQNTKSMLEDQLNIQSAQLKYNMKTAVENYRLQKENVELAKRVYDTYNRKFNEGIISSMELTQANSNYLEAESNYVQSVMSMLQAKLALDKLNNNL